MTTNGTNNQVQVECDNCHATHTLDLSTEEVGREPRQMGAEIQFDTTGDVECDCGQHIEYVQSEWEYPPGAFNHADSPQVTGGKVIHP